jgi:formylglycine-generating enzyme required for sulfatase activity
MDIPKLAEAIVAFLAPLLPQLLKAGDKALEKIGEQAGEKTWHWAGKLWHRLRPQAEAKPTMKEALEDAAKAPADNDAQAALRQQLKKLLEKDDSLAAELAQLLVDAKAAGVVIVAAGARSMAGRDMSDTIANTGDGNTIVKDSTVQFTQLVVDPTLARELLGLRKISPDLQRALEKYLQYLLDRYRYLDFKGLGVADRIPLRLELLDMFVPLKARIEMPKGETWSRDLELAGRRMANPEIAAVGERLSEPVPLLSLLEKHHGLVILGDPGAGKTTFLKYVALLHATGQCAEKRLPVLLPLSAYANALAERDRRLDDFIAGYFHDLGADLPLDGLLRQALEGGRALVMLDGLDEITDLNLRDTVVRRVVDFFTLHRRVGNKFLITSRIVGYREVRPSADGLEECTLVDFDMDEIAAFISKWTAALEKAASGDTAVAQQDAARERRELLDAIQHNSGVRLLAANPLLLTVLALMKRQGVTLPERRVELYQKYIETLLSSWNRARGLGRAPTHELDVGATLKVLAPLALWMHTVNPGVGLVKKVDLEDELQRLFTLRGEAHPELATHRFLDDVRQHASLLLERGPGQYGFIHLTFEEYLAAVALAQQGQESVDPVVQAILARVAEPAWREVILLAVGYLGIVQQRDKAASSVVHGLLNGARETKGLSVVVAGEAVVDACPSGVTPACRTETVKSLLGTIADGTGVEPRVRAEASNALARLGDPRAEVVPRKIEDLGAMEFCYVPPGPFVMGEEGRENQSLTHGYWIGRYPVTVAQYAWFVKNGGYRQKEWWDEARADKLWREGKFKDHEAYGGKLREAPAPFGEPFGMPNHPVVGITWYEAVAFCHWLTARWRGQLPPGWTLALPSEAEWEKAARGGKQILAQRLVRSIAAGLAAPTSPNLKRNPDEKRSYPWEGDFDPNRANCEQTQIGATSAVGCFPGGASPYGAEEMSGNVWEWTRSLRSNKQENPGAPKDASRVLRGGSWSHAYPESLRCSFRDLGTPGVRYQLIGFRCVWCLGGSAPG